MTAEERRREFLEWARAIVMALIIGCILSLTIRPTLVSGNSMAPTLNDRNYLIIDKVSYRFDAPHRGDVVVFKTQLTTAEGAPKDLIKRIVGIPGDYVVLREGSVYVNNQLLEEKYVLENFTDGEVALTVPENRYFVLGDNRKVSLDSRSKEVGLVPYDAIRGKILIRVLPINEFGEVK
ncbi:MAG: signal peptidase I [Clostridia bacterium]|nr:signal peptidase I [Clostridia bacterium]